MGKRGRQFVLLLWKNYLLQKRKKLTTVFEIGLPTLFTLILILIRLRVDGDMMTNITWEACPNWDTVNTTGNNATMIAYAPYNNATTAVMESLIAQEINLNGIKGFSNEDDMVNFLMFVNSTVNNTDMFIGGVMFTNDFPDGGDIFPEKVSYTIRLSSFPRHPEEGKIFNPDTNWKTQFMFPPFQNIGPREKDQPCGGAPGYQKEGFLAIQHAVDIALIQQMAPEDRRGLLDDVDVDLRRIPYPQYKDDKFIVVVQNQLPLVLMLGFVLIALNIVKDVVHEKERQLKESMKMMGLNNWLHWLAWFVKYFLFNLITVAGMTLFLCVQTSKGSVIGNTSPTIVMVYLLLYSISTISFCFAVSVFFSKANSGAAAGGILFFLTYVPYFFLQPRYQTLTWGQKMASCLISNVAMAYGGQLIGMYEGAGAGLNWSEVHKGISVDDNFSMSDIFTMLVVDAVLYAVIAWYVEAVFPGEYGIPQKWYFPFQPSYWCGTRPDEDVSMDKQASVGQRPEYFEADPIGLRAGIRIRNLRKVFNSSIGKKVAVSGMTMDMYEGQITALLGHNGAGKTTTMSMLTGFIPPSGGTAFVNGFDIRQDIASVRSSLGLCPQHDILFDTLTVEEHLIFFAKLKGCDPRWVKREVDAMISEVNLEDKRHAQSKSLSGGMKRKLSIGIALIAGSKVVILDEPSSGLDPNARRQIWSILQKNRAGRTMILTTHFMDEADLLGDRIAIMADGVVKCCGSSLFLKNKYGAGYHLTIVKQPGCNVALTTDLIQTHVPEAKLENNVGAELSYILPHERSSAFVALFTELEDGKDKLGISSYGASVTTMEEVFLRVGDANAETKESKSANGHTRRHSVNGDVVTIDGDEETNEKTPLLSSNGAVGYSSTRAMARTTSFTHEIAHNTGMALKVEQFYAMFLKRALHSLRNKVVTGVQLAVPLFFTIAALIFIKTFPGPQDSKALSLTPGALGVNFVTYSENPQASKARELGGFYGSQFEGYSDTSTVFVNNQSGFTNESDIIQFLLGVGHADLGSYNLKYLIGADINDTNGKLFTTAFFNNQAYHTTAISLATLGNALLRYISDNSRLSLQATNHPLPRTPYDKLRDQVTADSTGFTISFNIVFGMAFLASSFTLFLIKERAVKSKHLQFSSGVSLYTFWAATFWWDLINYLMAAVCLLITLWAFDIDAFSTGESIGHIALLFLLYGMAMLPFMYLWSFLFNVPATGYVWITMFNILSGEATVLAVNILRFPSLGLVDLSRVLEWVFLLVLPNFCLGQGLADYYSNFQFKPLYDEFCVALDLKDFCLFPNPCCAGQPGGCGDLGCIYYNDNALGWEADGIGRMLVFLAIQSVLYSVIVLLLESEAMHHLVQFCCRKTAGTASEHELDVNMEQVQEDDDVARERTRLLEQEGQVQDKLAVSELTKFYGNHLAVNRISVGIQEGECFGLLGINGAGKTTTFKMLTGDETVSEGKAYVNGHSIIDSIAEVRENLGYCPQFDALIDQMTGRETLHMYARLRGIHRDNMADVVNDLLDALLITEHADKLVQTYSGGNKRKLSTAIALVGNPPVVFLDEPTTGMDPRARRYLWDTLSSIRASGRTLILTSHSMEECEALCTRLAIMVNGQFKCLGSVQHLKNKFGEGYTLIAQVGANQEGAVPDPSALKQFIESHFPHCVLKDVHQGRVHYHITDTSLKWAEIFGVMERAKADFNIEDYSVSQTTLEQVFINFARAQVPPRDSEKKSGCPCCIKLPIPICC